MESFCPLCAKSGIRRRIKAFQINLEEAVWGCESEECSWPIGHEKLIFFPRSVISCNWDDPNPVKEKLPALTELSLYTPPVTPGGELSKESTEIVSTENVSSPPMEDPVGILSRYELLTSSNETDGFNKSSLVELLQGDIKSATKDRNVTNEQIVDFKTLSKFIEKTNTNHIFLSNINEYDNEKIQEHEHSFMDAMDTFKNLDISDSVFTEFDVSVQQNTGNKWSECGRLQWDARANGVETNFDMDSLPETLVNLDVTNNLNTTSESTMNSSSIDMLLEDILNKRSILVDTNDDWLDMLMS